MKKPVKLFIFYFSGTGNSKAVSQWIYDIANSHGIPAEINNIADIERRHMKAPSSNDTVIFISPIHGFNYPPVMLKFILRFPPGKNQVVLMNTRAGMRIGNLITPGLTGVAFFFSALVLKMKGYSIQGMIPVDLPSNWISIHPGLNDRAVKFLFIKNRERVQRNITKIITGKKNFIALREIIQDTLIAPFSLAYYLIGRFFFAKTYFATSKCNNCGQCIRNCPVKAIEMKDSRPYWTFNCECCMKCMSNCPEKAIETAHGLAVVVILLNSLWLAPLIYLAFEKFNILQFSHLAQSLIESGIFLVLLGIIYRLIHYGLRYRLIETLMAYTSLTRLKWWGRRYKAPKNS
jgi:Pyruvate/2-oxoacid:ferredoxin oxidoreductase delta subunit